MTWDNTSAEWEAFLQEVRLARAHVGATYAGAWFRGQTHDWPLLPSLYRATKLIEQEIEQRRLEGRGLQKRIREAKAYARNRLGIPDGIDARVRSLEEAVQRVDQRIQRLEARLPQPGTGWVHGEGRAYVEYRFRSGAFQYSSWQTLAEMQHYGVPTRLLDWTESFVLALAFALQDQSSALEKMWNLDRREITFDRLPKLLKHHDIPPRLIDGAAARPALWVMNPYRLAHVATGEELLWDMTANADDDYFANFVARDDTTSKIRTFDKPFPMLSPWRDERIAAQQGLFTCHTKLPRPLDELCGSTVLTKVPISPQAALHGVRFLYEFAGLDVFTMFRDKDSLGKKTSREFFPHD